MPFYVGDYLADTQLLTTEQHGAYLLLILAYWKNQGALPIDDAILASVCKMMPEKWQANKPVLLGYFQVKRGKLVHERIEKEIKATSEKRQKAKEKSDKANAKRWPESPSRTPTRNPSRTPSHNHSHSTSTLPEDEFLSNYTYLDTYTGEIQ